MRQVFIGVFCTLLAGCLSTERSETRIVCPTLRIYTGDFLGKADTQFKRAGPQVREMIGDYQNLRDQVRACRR